MKKLRQIYLGYLSLFLLLFSTISWGQIDITKKDVFYKLRTDNDIEAESNYLLVDESNSRVAINTLSSRKLASIPTTISTLGADDYISYNEGTSTNKIWKFENKGTDSGYLRWYIRSVENNQYLKKRTDASRNTELALVNSPSSIFGIIYDANYWLLNYNSVRNFFNYDLIGSGNHGYYKLNQSSNTFTLESGNAKTSLYRMLQINNFNPDDVTIGEIINFNSITASPSGVITIEVEDVMPQVAGETIYEINNNIITFLKPGTLTIKALVTTNSDRPNFYKKYSITIQEVKSCFDGEFSNDWSTNLNTVNIDDKLSNNQLSTFPNVTGDVYKYKSGLRLKKDASIRSKDIGYMLPNNTNLVTVEFYVKKSNSNENSSIKVGFVQTSTSTFYYNGLSPVLSISKNINETNSAYELIRYTFDGIPKSGVRLWIKAENDVWLDDVRINCINTNAAIWTRAGWLNGLPDISREVIIRNPTFPSNLVGIYAKDLKLEVSDFEVPKGNFLMVDENLYVKDANQNPPINSNLTFNKGAYLFLGEDAIVKGDVKFKTLSSYYYNDMKIVSSPVIPQLIKNNHNAFHVNNKVNALFLNSQTRRWDPINTNIFEEGYGVGLLHTEGHKYRSDQNNPSKTNLERVFFGSVNNNKEIIKDLNLSILCTSDISCSRSKNTLGNPYSAPISIDRFLNDNPNVDFIELWKNDNTYDFKTSDYVNSSFWIKCNTFGCANHLNKEYLNVDLGVGFVATLKRHNVQLPVGNTDRYDYKDNPKIVFQHSQKAFELIDQFQNNRILNDKSKLYLSLEEDENILHNEILFGYADKASDDYDSNYDAEYTNNNRSLIAIFNNDKKFEIETRQAPLDEFDVFKIFFKTNNDSSFRIKLNDFTNEFNNVNIFLKDNFLNKYVNLKNDGEYLFESLSGEYSDRFEIHFSEENLNTQDLKHVDFELYKIGEDYYVDSKDIILSYNVYDISGRHLKSETKINLNKFKLKLFNDKQVFIVNFKTKSGHLISKKIILK